MNDMQYRKIMEMENDTVTRVLAKAVHDLQKRLTELEKE